MSYENRRDHGGGREGYSGRDDDRDRDQDDDRGGRHGRQDYGGGRDDYEGQNPSSQGGGPRYGGGGGGRDEYLARGEEGGHHGSGGRRGREDEGQGEGASYYDQRQDYADEPSQRRRPDNNNNSGDDLDGAADHAKKYADDTSEPSLFSNALSFLKQHKSSVASEPVDESQAVAAHQAVYNQQGGGEGQQHDAQGLGAAAAMNALKMFTGGGGGGGQQQGGGQGQGGQNQFIGMAMAEAGKLFESQSASGNVASGASKQDVVTQAATMALKMYMQSGGGGGGGGGMGGLLGMASKFM